MTPQELLRLHPFFSGLSAGDIDKLAARSSSRRLPAGRLVFHKGAPGDGLYGVLSGRIAFTMNSLEGRTLTLNALGPGEFFGEIALLDGKERTADATAATDCELLIVPRRSLFSLLERRPDLCIDLLVVLCERLRRTNEQVEDLAFLDLEARIAKVLVRLAEENGAGQSRTRPVGVKISQRALGELVGGSRESVNKHLQDWKRSGFIAIEKGSIVIHDIEALADLGADV